MIGTSAAMSHNDDDRVDRDVERAFGDQQVLPEVADAARCASSGATRAMHPLADAVGVEALRVSHANESCASSSAATDDTAMRSPSRNAPSPRPAHHRIPSAGADTTPSDELARVLEPDQRRPDRHAAHVALRAVDRVDDPAVLGVVVASRRRSPNSSPSTA